MANSYIGIGELDTQVTLQSVSQGHGTRGEITTVYSQVCQPWAKVEANLDETIANDNLEQGRSYRVTLHKADAGSATTRWRVVIDSVTYEVRSIDPIDRMSPFCILTVYSIQ